MKRRKFGMQNQMVARVIKALLMITPLQKYIEITPGSKNIEIQLNAINIYAHINQGWIL